MNQDYQFFQNDELYTQPPQKKNAAYYRARAREMLKGKYWMAVLAFFLASLLGGVSAGSSGSIEFNLGESSEIVSGNISYHLGEIFSLLAAGDIGGVLSYHPAILIFVIVFSIAMIATVAFSLFVSSPVILGYRRFNLDLADGKKPDVAVLFSYFKRGYGKFIGANLLMGLINFAISLPIFAVTAFLLVPTAASVLASTVQSTAASVAPEQWTALLIALLVWLLTVVICAVISILVHYRLYFAHMVLAEYPEMRVIDAFRNSVSLMKGNKWRLFCLELSFIGWEILASVIPYGIGVFFLQPYIYAATTAFYDDIAQRATARETEFPSLDPNDYNTDGTAF